MSLREGWEYGDVWPDVAKLDVLPPPVVAVCKSENGDVRCVEQQM